jgi:hypothetical protein
MFVMGGRNCWHHASMASRYERLVHGFDHALTHLQAGIDILYLGAWGNEELSEDCRAHGIFGRQYQHTH